jgi:hypothetical protein
VEELAPSVLLEVGATATIALSIPPVPQTAIDSLRESLTVWWTGFVDTEPEVDYLAVEIAVGRAKTWCFIPTPPLLNSGQ